MGVYKYGGKIATKSLAPGFRVYAEEVFKKNGKEYRVWNPFKSKLAAAIKKGLKNFPFKEGINVLYLGAATGTTCSHVSDLIGKKGKLFCVEFSADSMKELIKVCEKRRNMYPILADARTPENYEKIVGKVEVVYEDVADPEQVKILEINAKKFLKKNGIVMLALKAPCIDSSEKKGKIYEETEKQLKKEFEIVEKIDLEPFEKEHRFYVLKQQ